MTPGIDPNTVISGVLDTLRQARSLLLDPSPHNIDRCRVAISQSVLKVVAVMEGDRAAWNRNELKDALLKMRGELSAIAKLLDSAAAFRRDMLKVTAGTARPLLAEFEPDAGALETARRVHILG